MGKLLYLKLALTNLKNNRKTYIPYILTCIGTILMFYNLCFLTFHTSTGKSNTFQLMFIGTIVTAIFSVIFLFYTNSFLIKRRMKEFGLFNILGMEKKHIGRVMLWESIFITITSIALGLLFGIIFSKLSTLVLYKILMFDPDYGFEISGAAINITVLLFLGIFLLTLLNNLRYVHTSKPIELLRSSNVGEKEPKTRWIIAIIGLLTLGAGYYMALSLENPLAAMSTFLVAAILVIIGTYCLFTAVSIAILKLLRKNKGYYYQTKHFTTVSGMIYRMKQNAVGLANICIISTAVLVTISTTISMYAGITDIIDRAMPTDIAIHAEYYLDNNPKKESFEQKIQTILKKNSIKATDFSSSSALNYACNREGSIFVKGESSYVSMNSVSLVNIMSLDDYQRVTGKAAQLADNEILFYNEDTSIGGTVTLFGTEYSIKQWLDQAPIGVDPQLEVWNADYSCIVVSNDKVLNILSKEISNVYTQDSGAVNYDITFNLKLTDEQEIQLVDKLKAELKKDDYGFEYLTFDLKQKTALSFYETYGGLFFIGILLGMLFLMAAVLIIYYKQVIEGFEDKERFQIMQKVGMSREEVKKSISSQVLTVFLLPLIMAIVHVIVAFPILSKLLALLNLTNVSLFMVCTIATVLVFAIIYAIVYALTARVYYRIVNQ